MRQVGVMEGGRIVKAKRREVGVGGKMKNCSGCQLEVLGVVEEGERNVQFGLRDHVGHREDHVDQLLQTEEVQAFPHY